MDYMKFCPHCGSANKFQMPYCINCGHQLVIGDSLDYKQAKQNFDTYLNAHQAVKARFSAKHFQICRKCHRKCTLAMKYCCWCGAKLDQQDQYKNYKFLITTSNVIPDFTYSIIRIVSFTTEITNDETDVAKAIQGLKDQCVKHSGNTIIGFHLLSSQLKLTAYGTAVSRKPLK